MSGPGLMSDESGDPESYLLLNRQRKHRIDRCGLSDFITLVMDYLHPAGTFSIVLVSDRVIRRYNLTYRDVDKSTDVLSFPGDEGYLGDILISTETAYSQARKSQTLSFETNLKRLTLHGLLHLMGYNHETDDGEMRALERRLRWRFRC